MDDAQLDPRFLRGIELFNDCEFHEAHDEWESIWMDIEGDTRNFYKGLIQVAVCLHHFVNGNIRGARKLYGTSTTYLKPYAPVHSRLNVEKLLAQLEVCCASIMASQEEYPKIDIDPDQIPEIDLLPA